MDTYPAALIPDSVTETEPEFKTTMIEFGQGHEQRLNDWWTDRTKWTLKYSYVLTPVKDQIVGFFKAQAGKLKSWQIIDPRINGGAVTTVRFEEDSIRVQNVKAVIHNISFQIIEVFA